MKVSKFYVMFLVLALMAGLTATQVLADSAALDFDGNVLDGSLKSFSSSQRRKLLEWIANNRVVLEENWARRQRGESMTPIGPWL